MKPPENMIRGGLSPFILRKGKISAWVRISPKANFFEGLIKSYSIMKTNNDALIAQFDRQTEVAREGRRHYNQSGSRYFVLRSNYVTLKLLTIRYNIVHNYFLPRM